MKHGFLNAFVLLSSVTCSAVTRGQSFEADSPRHANPSGASEMTQVTRGSWESWLRHDTREFPPQSSVSSPGHDFGALTAPTSPAVGPGSTFLGPKTGGSHSRLGSTTETECRGNEAGKAALHRDF